MSPAARLATLQRSVRALSDQRLGEALAAAADVLVLHPTDADARALVRAVGMRAEASPLIEGAVEALVRAGDLHAAGQVRAAVIQRIPTVPGAWAALATLQEQAGDARTAERTLRQGLEHASDSVGLRCQLALVLARQDRAEEAEAQVALARRAAPERLRPIWTALRCLPLVHESEASLEASRAEYIRRLVVFEDAVQQVDRLQAKAALGFAQDAFPAHYACRPEDSALQGRFGSAVHRLVSTAHPDLVAPLPPRESQGRVRVGFVSTLLRRHTVAKLFGPWILGLDPSRFEVHVWQLGPVDSTTRALAEAGAQLHGADGVWPEGVGRSIRATGLDAVVFPEVGMDARLMLLAAMRLAPFQCVAWGHPVTTGLPTVDAFLSADAMERDDAETDYTEELVRMPGIGTAFERPPPPAGDRTRSDFGLPEGGTLLLCTQSLFKLLPGRDAVLRRILDAVPDAHFAYLDLVGGEGFRERLARSGLPMERVTGLPRLPFSDFLELNALADVVLDGLDWSGGVTALEAVSCGRLLVTLEGRLMRTRHTGAILRRLGLPELVAEDEDAYVATVVRLATDPAWRLALETRVVAAAPSLYGDPCSTEALGRLLEARRG